MGIDEMLRAGRATPAEILLALDVKNMRLSEYGRRAFRMRKVDRGDGGFLIPPIFGGASWSDFMENKILDHVYGGTAYTPVDPLFIALCTVVPTDSSTGSTITEASYTGYGRIRIAGTDWAAAASGSKASRNTLTGAACTAGSSTIIGFAICDAATVGNMISWGTCTSTVISTTQTPPTINAGVLTHSQD